MARIEIEKVRQFLTEVSQLSYKYKLPVFTVTKGASITVDSNLCDAV